MRRPLIIDALGCMWVPLTSRACLGCKAEGWLWGTVYTVPETKVTWGRMWCERCGKVLADKCHKTSNN
jgi:hypothetical protein